MPNILASVYLHKHALRQKIKAEEIELWEWFFSQQEFSGGAARCGCAILLDTRRQTTVWYGTRKDHQNVNRDTGANEPTRRRNVLSLVNESLCHSYSSLIPSRPSLSARLYGLPL